MSADSQKSLPDQPRQFPAATQENSSMRSGKTLPAGSVLEDMLSRLSEQIQLNASRQENEDPHELADELPERDIAVNNLLIGGVQKNKK